MANLWKINDNVTITYEVVPDADHDYRVQVTVVKNGEIDRVFVSPRPFKSYGLALEAKTLLIDRVHGSDNSPIWMLQTMLGVQS